MNYHVIQLNLQRHLLNNKIFSICALNSLNLLNIVKLDFMGEILLKGLNLME